MTLAPVAAAGAVEDRVFSDDGREVTRLTSAQQEAAYRAVLRAARMGRISRERLRLSLQRVLALKRRYGLSLTVTRTAGRRPAHGRTAASSPPPPDRRQR